MAEYRYEWVLRVMRHETASWHSPPRKKDKRQIVPWPPPPLKNGNTGIPGRSNMPFAKWVVENRAAVEGQDDIAHKDLAKKAEWKEKTEAAGEDEEKPKD